MASEGNEVLLLLAFSGGGKRSAAFAHGALRGLAQVPVDGFGGGRRSLLDEVDYISAVSGGSFPAVHFGLHRGRSFETFPDEFLHQDINARIWGMYLLPWHWEWLANPYFGTNDYMAAVYDRLMFRGATYADLARRGRPLISVNATDVTNGLPFPFLGTTFGLICSDLNRFPLARAVAASNGFPVLFSPITLRNHAASCGGARPRTAPGESWSNLGIEREREAMLARAAARYADPEAQRWVHLMDGGIADNLALRGLHYIFLRLQDEPDSLRRVAARTRRLIVISVDGEAAADPTLAQRRVVSGLGRIFGAVSGTQIDTLNFETRAIMREQIAAVVRRFRESRCRQGGPGMAGRCDDVEGRFIHVSLGEVSDPALRARLQAIPTGLTIPREDVDALVAQGEAAMRGNRDLLALIEPRPGPGPGILAGQRRRREAVTRPAAVPPEIVRHAGTR
jgi:NTE family protein